MRTRSLRKDLFVRIVALVLPTVALVIGIHWKIEVRLLEELFGKSLKEKATALATLVTERDGRLQLSFADEFMTEYSSEDSSYYFQVWSSDAETLERSVSLGAADLPHLTGTLEEPEFFETVLEDGRDVRCVGIRFPMRLGHGPPGSAVQPVAVVVGADGRVLDAILRDGAFEVIATAGLSVLAITLMILLALRHGVRVVESLSSRLGRLEPGLHDRLEEEEFPVELRPIVASLNRMLSALRSQGERDRRFNADVAHELRTPISELRAAVDVATEWPDAESTARLVRHAGAIAEQMQLLVESLLELSRLETGTGHGELREFDLARAVRLQMDEASNGLESADLLRYEGPDELTIRSNPVLWEVTLRNLLGNALEYSVPGSPIEVRLQPRGPGVRLAIENRVPRALEPDELRGCLERLGRGHRGEESPFHSGLGLSIVQAACARTGHALEVSCVGTRFIACVTPVDSAAGYSSASA